MTSQPVATVEIQTIDLDGRPRHVFHGAMRSLADAFSEVARHAPAPVNQWVCKRVAADGGGQFNIGQLTVSIAVLA